MGMNTQKLIVLILATNIVMSMVTAIVFEPTTFDNTIFEKYMDYGNDISEQGRNQELNIQRAEGVQSEQSAGNLMNMGILIYKIMANGLSPIPAFGIGEISDPVEGLAYGALSIFRLFLYALISLELYQLIKNRKTGGG